MLRESADDECCLPVLRDDRTEGEEEKFLISL